MRKTILISSIMTFLIAGCASMDSVTKSHPKHVCFYVATDGDDANPGTKAMPFETIEKAQMAVRQMIGEGLKSDVTVYLRGGTYYLPKGIVFDAKDSGDEQYGIMYKAYKDEVPRLVGGMPLKDYRVYKGDIMVAEIPEGMTAGHVFENNQRLTLARAPDEGYFKTIGAVDDNDVRAFYYDPNHFNPADWDYSQATIFIWQGSWQGRWFSQDKPIETIDPDKHIIRMGTDAGYPMKQNYPCTYYVKNVLALLDRPGECMIDQKGRKAYFWCADGKPGDQELVLATAESVIKLNSTRDNPMQNLHFQGLDVTICREYAVQVSGARNCSVKFCRIENAGKDGVFFNRYSQYNVLYGCEIRNNGMYGVQLYNIGPSDDAIYENHHHLIENNHIHHCGQLVGHGAGIMVYQSGHNRIVHNDIHHMPRYGTALNGFRYQIARERIKDMTWENHYDYMFTRNNLLAYNHIHHVNLETQDTGAMESWGPGRDNVYHNNLIHDTGNLEFDVQSGIYLDDASDFFTVTNNIIYNVIGSNTPHYLNQCIYAKGIHNDIQNNIIIVSKYCRSGISSFEMGGERVDNHKYLNNIIAFEEPVYEGDRYIYYFENYSDDRVSASDWNVFYNPYGLLMIGGGHSAPSRSYEQWLEMHQRRYETHSVVADPCFVDLAGRDFRLKPDSPALKLGFEPIDIEPIGLKADFPERFE